MQVNTPFESSAQQVPAEAVTGTRRPAGARRTFLNSALALLIALLVALLVVAVPAYTDRSATDGTEYAASTAEHTTSRHNPGYPGRPFRGPGGRDRTTTTR